MHQWISVKIKNIRLLYTLYFYIISVVLRLLSCFVSQNDKLILFNSYGGKKYDDSPRALYEAMQKDIRFCDFHFVWAFHEPKNFVVPGATVIGTDSIKYFMTALRARIWITNSGIERGLDFKPERIFYVNTWHGSAIKKMGKDISSGNLSFGGHGKMRVNLMNAQNDQQADIFSRVFDIPKENFVVCGYPRNDELFSFKLNEKICWNIRRKLNIPEGKKVILYAPTFREFERDRTGCILKPPIDLMQWKNKIGNQYVLLFRAHYEVARVMKFEPDDFVYDVTDYPNLNELMIVSDLLISDYSSIIFDYLILDKPILQFCYDYEKYKNLRGMYIDIRNYFNGSSLQDDLLNLLDNLDFEQEKMKTRKFKAIVSFRDGNAVKETIDAIVDRAGLVGRDI